MKLNIKSFSLTCALIWGLGLFFLTFWVMALGRGEGLACISSIYPGYSVSVAGAFIGLGYALVDGFIGGFFFSWLYNKLLPKT